MVEEPQEYTTTAHLIIQDGPRTGKRLEIWKDLTTIGRSRDCDIFLEDISVHRKQASIVRTVAGFVLRDDHGKGDSFVNGQSINEQLLKHGDQLLFGATKLVYYGNEGTRPFQLASSRGNELHVMKRADHGNNPRANFDLVTKRGTLRSYEVLSELTIGRSRECDIFLEDLAVSRLHATIHELSDGGFEIEDHRSASGTFVNGLRITRYRLLEGDNVQIGSHRLTFRRLQT
ncbi:MAG TPA: FHA domain-containing protein [Ktedonobacteraceae bacterium]|nr:FHA domain-containing protein [Ktedonobacteraceae bacterium]